MARYDRFTFLCNKKERHILVALAARLQRSQSDTVRLLIREAARELKAQKQSARGAAAGVNRKAAGNVLPRGRRLNDNPIVVAILLVSALFDILAYVTGDPNLPQLLGHIVPTAIATTQPTVPPIINVSRIPNAKCAQHARGQRSPPDISLKNAGQTDYAPNPAVTSKGALAKHAWQGDNLRISILPLAIGVSTRGRRIQDTCQKSRHFCLEGNWCVTRHPLFMHLTNHLATHILFFAFARMQALSRAAKPRRCRRKFRRRCRGRVTDQRIACGEAEKRIGRGAHPIIRRRYVARWRSR
jgi:hypothetical protein